MSTNPVIISIDGLIGAGKSTVINLLKNKKSYVCLEENTKEWTFLDQFYKNMKHYGSVLQFQILISQFCQMVPYENKNERVILVERSPWTTKNVFCQILKKNENFDRHWWKNFEMLYTKLSYKVDYLIFLSVEPDELLQRIIKRQRKAETSSGGAITLEYLQLLDLQYKTALNELDPKTVFIINAQLPIEEVIKQVNDCIETICARLEANK